MIDWSSYSHYSTTRSCNWSTSQIFLYNLSYISPHISVGNILSKRFDSYFHGFDQIPIFHAKLFSNIYNKHFSAINTKTFMQIGQLDYSFIRKREIFKTYCTITTTATTTITTVRYTELTQLQQAPLEQYTLGYRRRRREFYLRPSPDRNHPASMFCCHQPDLVPAVTRQQQIVCCLRLSTIVYDSRVNMSAITRSSAIAERPARRFASVEMLCYCCTNNANKSC